MYRPERMSFGIFMPPFHRVGENPTLAIHRDMELIQWLDDLGFDEAWIGEHHSAGWETISEPALIIAAVAEKTRRIMLGSGVSSLPYHHPLTLADRFVQLDHMTRGRSMLGVGPGALVSDAWMMGIDPVSIRPRMDEALGVIIRLLNGEVVTHKSDWFELRDARLQLLPYTRPCFPIAVASAASPTGMVTAGKHGVGVLGLGGSMPGGKAAMAGHWAMAEEAAAKAGKTISRADWRVVTHVHLAESREEAIRQVEQGRKWENVEYYSETLGNHLMDTPLEAAIESDALIVGTPDDAIAAIERLLEASGGFGGLLIVTKEWTSRANVYNSYELFARYVMPRFQHLLPQIEASRDYVSANRRAIFAPNVQAIVNAFRDAGREPPPEVMARRGERVV